jgi:FRG domain-containing protein
MDHAKWLESLRDFLGRREAAGTDAPFMDEYSGEEAFEKFVLSGSAETWEDFHTWMRTLDEGSWCFRGQREAAWSLTTSLDRAVRREKTTTTGDSLYHLDRAEVEADLLFRFQQQAPQYLTHLPAQPDRASWLAMMQHYGVPTRLLDWTGSPYAGMYFALEEEPLKEEKRSALWAIDMDWLKAKGDELLFSRENPALPSEPALRAREINRLLEATRMEQGVILSINPILGNDRLASQQGILLCKLFPRAPFYQVLMRMMIKPSLTERPVIRKLEVSAATRIEFLKRLRTMNIHRSSLFPGLDGFGRFLKIDLEMQD